MNRIASAFATLVLALAACGGSDDAAAPTSPGDPPAGTPPPSSSSGITFHRDVAPILQSHCQGCHVQGGIAPFPLVAYEDAKDIAAAIVQMTSDRLMPPWGAQETADCTPTRKWKNDLRLNDAELATLKAWSDGGAAEGDPKDAPVAKAAPSFDLVGAQTKLQPATGFAMSGTSDKMMCFVLDPKLGAQTFFDGMQVVPEHPEVVHHVLVFADPTGESRKKADANGMYECFGGPQVAGATLMTAWAPGGVANELPAGVGMPLDAGALVVMQVHYHAAPGVSAPPDRTSVQLRALATPPALHAYTQLVGNFKSSLGGSGLMPGPNDTNGKVEFRIPPNAKDHTETMRLVMPSQLKGKPVSSFKLLSSGAHMHYVGVGETIRVSRQSGGDECLLSVPRWDFDWQRGYVYDAPLEQLPTFTPGDALSIECRYDNTMQNPKMGRALREAGLTQPIEVTLGESTLDEMCLGAFVFVYQP